MINQLRQFYNDSGEIVISYDPEQEELYRKAARELWEAATSWGLNHHSYELLKKRNQIQREYRNKNLLLDLFPLPKGIHKNEGNFSAMVLKHFLQTHGFHVLVSEEDYYLMWERRHHYTNDGFKIIETIFGTKRIAELLRRAPQGGDPDVFAFLDHTPELAWFIEAKRQNEAPTKKQIQNFPHIKELLCPVEIARIVPIIKKKQEENPMVKKQQSVSLISENNLLALKNQNDKVVHIVFPDRTSGKLRICRPSMLNTTHGSVEAEWEVVGRVRDVRYYVEGVKKIRRRPCRECLGHLPPQTKTE
jgi:hypothetical protein